jgi:hypothetical protein
VEGFDSKPNEPAINAHNSDTMRLKRAGRGVEMACIPTDAAANADDGDVTVAVERYANRCNKRTYPR